MLLLHHIQFAQIPMTLVNIHTGKELIGDLLASDSVKWIEMHLPLFRLFEKAATKKK